MTVLRVTVPDQYFCTKHPDLNITAREIKNQAGTDCPCLRRNIHLWVRANKFKFPKTMITKYCFPNLHWILVKAFEVEDCEFVPVHHQQVITKNGQTEDFCVKWGPNEDHFSSLVLMRTKSSIEDLCASSGYYINGRYFIQISQNGDMIYCRTWKCITLPLNEEMWKYPPIFCLTCLS